MCVAFPGKVVGIEDKVAKVDFGGNIVDVRIGLVEAKEGDYVLAHAGCAIEVMSEEKAMEIIETFKDIEELGQ